MLPKSEDRVIAPETLAVIEAMTAKQVTEFLQHISDKRLQYSDLTETEKDILDVIRRKHADWAMRRAT